MSRAIQILLAVTILLAAAIPTAAEEQKKSSGGPPPMLVTTESIVSGSAEPTANFVGTIFYSRTAEVAADVDGIVEEIYANDGDTLKKGDRLVRLDDDLLSAEINGTRSTYEQNLIDVNQAEKDYQRIAALYQQEAIATSEYEAYETRLSRLQKQSAILKARLDRQRIEQKKKTVRAPFDGLVIETLVDAGEWVKEGGIVATLADNSRLEAHVDIPAEIIPYLETGRDIELTVAGQQMTGRFITIIPRGEISTRTFVAKFSLPADKLLIEGMQAQITLPVAKAENSLLIPRDALIKNNNRDVVFVNDNGQARMVAVTVTGYSGDKVGVQGEELDVAQQVVVKGSERIRDGQKIRTE